MTDLPSRLRASLFKLQKVAAKFYLLLQQRFEGNHLVSHLWAAMGNDLQLQTDSLKKLPRSFWQSLKKQEKELIEVSEEIQPQNRLNMAISLSASLVQTLDLEEPIILNVYAPLIRHLRINWTDLALDFYVMVKAHIVRLAQLIQLYSGDPSLSLRCAVLLQNLERGIQEAAVVEATAPSSATPKKSGTRHAKSAGIRRALKPAERRVTGLPQEMSKRSKPLLQKIKLSQRRAQR